MYAPSAILAQCFTSMFLESMTLPMLGDIISVMQSQLDMCKYPPILCEMLVVLFTHIEMMENKLLSLAKLSVPSLYFSAKHVTNSALPLKFFELITDATYMTSNHSGMEVYFSELSMYVIMFNNVSETRVKNVVALIVEVNDFVKRYELQAIQHNDSRACDCEEYTASGDCGCYDL